MTFQKFCSTTVLHMVLESLINHSEFLPKYPCPCPDACRQKSLAIILFFVYVTSIFNCPETHPTLFPRWQNLLINILSLKSTARYLQAQPREGPQCCLQKHSNVFSKFQLGLPLVHLLCSPLPAFFPLSWAKVRSVNLFSAVYTWLKLSPGSWFDGKSWYNGFTDR